MTYRLFIANRDAEIESCFPVFQVLRPHISHAEFLPQIRRQQAQSYQIVALQHEEKIKSAAGFRFAEFLAWGKVLYIDDLTTLESERGRSYASTVLDWLIERAKQSECSALHLDTGFARHAAHRVYLQKGFQLSSHHMALLL